MPPLPPVGPPAGIRDPEGPGPAAAPGHANAPAYRGIRLS